MFGGKSTKRSSHLQQDTTTKQKNLDIDDIEHLLHDSLTTDGEAGDINESDLNDPELLAQLQALASSSSNKKETKTTTKQTVRPSATHKGDPMDIDWDSYASLTQTGDDDDIQVELDENDFSDPHLLNELSAISSALPMDIDKPQPETAEPNENGKSILQLTNMGFSQNQAKTALDMFDNDMERATNYLLDSPLSNDKEEVNDMDQQVTIKHDLSTPPAPPPHRDETLIDSPKQQNNVKAIENIDAMDDTLNLKEKAKVYQQRALLAKKQGNKKEAVALLRESKLLMQQYQLSEQEETMVHDNVSISKDSPGTKTPPSISPIATPPTTVKEELVTAAPPSTSSPSPALIKAQQDLLQRVVLLQREYKDAAHHYKDLGNLAVTKEMIQISKSLLKTGIQLKQLQLTEQEVEQTSKRLPDHPDLFLGNGKLRSAQPVTEFNQPTFEQMEAQLTYQIDICHNLDIQRRSNSNSKTNSSQQSSLLPLKQAFAADLVTLRAYNEQQSGGSPSIPSLHYEQVDYAYKNILDHLPLNQMELKIIQGTGIQSLDIGTTVEPYVTWDFGGWPPENTAQAQLNKGETPVVKGTEPVFDFTILIPITRTNRVFMRHLQRKRLLLEVFHNKYSYGFLRRPVSIGKVTIPLDTLLTKASISGWFDLLDSNRKKTGGKLKIQLGMCEPLNGQDIVSKSERWLVIDGLSQQTSQLMYSAGLTSAPFIPSSSSSQGSSNIPAPSSTPVQAARKTPQTQMDMAAPMDTDGSPLTKETNHSPSVKDPPQDTPVTNNPELETSEEEIDNVDSLVSNMVLDHEINVANAAISKGTMVGSRTKEDWVDRKQALDIKMNMLVIQVQTGMLDMQTYLDNVEKRMNRDRQLALVFKKYNRLDLAKLALSRKKIMQDELDEAKAAMAAQAEEDD